MCVCTQSLSHVWLFATPWTVAHQAPLSMGFSRQEYGSGLLFLFARDLYSRDQTCELHLPNWQAGSLPWHHLCYKCYTIEFMFWPKFFSYNYKIKLKEKCLKITWSNSNLLSLGLNLLENTTLNDIFFSPKISLIRGISH